MNEQQEKDGKPLSRINWWKVAFFVAALAFEFTRELFVIEKAQPIPSYVMAHVYDLGDSVIAQGRWWRTDKTDTASRLITTTVTIECSRETHQCMEVSAAAFNGLMAPEIERYPASFGPDLVTYENDSPNCARYVVRVDTKLQTVTALRERKEKPDDMCKKLEPRIEMKLGDGWRSDDNSMDGHFVPVLSIIRSGFELFRRTEK